MLNVREFYQTVWEEYADPEHHPITASSLAAQARIVGAWIRETEASRILDLGCGPEPVIQAGRTQRAVCADLVPEMLRHVRRSRGLPVVCLDAHALPFRPATFDLVWCGLLADHIDTPAPWIDELLRLLVPGGTLGMACWQRARLPSERYPDDTRMRYTLASGRELCVTSYPCWEETLRILQGIDPEMDLLAETIVPDAYVLQVARIRTPSG